MLDKLACVMNTFDARLEDMFSEIMHRRSRFTPGHSVTSQVREVSTIPVIPL